MFQGQSIQLAPLDDGIVELCFDRAGEAINKLDGRTVDEFRQATAIIAAAVADGRARGVLITSAKDAFIVGADITEFGRMFSQPAAEIAADVLAKNQIFVAFEDLPVPSVAVINGFALGGGLELALAASHRVMSAAAQVGLPEVKLGLFPGFGGTVRMCRVAGAATAIDWVAGGKPAGAAAAQAAGVVDAVAEPGALRGVALALLKRAMAAEADWQPRQLRKRAPLAEGDGAQALKALFAEAEQRVAAASPRHQPAALSAVRMMARASLLERGAALELEAQAFAEVATTQAARAMVQSFQNDQAVKKLVKAHGRDARKVGKVAVLGAGIMGGGIAYTNAARGTPVLLKDIAPAALEAGLGEAAKLLARQVKSGRLAQDRADAVLATISAQAGDAGLDGVDLVVEAIVEKLEVKRSVLAELESSVRADTVIASNTSSLRIDDIAAPLARPENLVGMHFFNPVPLMPLVEVIRGSRTSDVAVATAVAHALAMGKTPIVVKDCPGFLVNRIIAPYVNGFTRLVADGADFAEVDRVMEAFGWPMGPAYLQDVVGMDVGAHVGEVIAAGYPERMQPVKRNIVAAMVNAGRYGQKNGKGFYAYAPDAAGKPRRSADPGAAALAAGVQAEGPRAFSDEEIVERMMLPMIVEAAHALEEGVVSSAAELDMALLMGIGFPAHAGGALQYADWLGLAHVVARCEHYAQLGPAYRATARMREMAAAGCGCY